MNARFNSVNFLFYFAKLEGIINGQNKHYIRMYF
jgi:hypothetical protein